MVSVDCYPIPGHLWKWMNQQKWNNITRLCSSTFIPCHGGDKNNLVSLELGCNDFTSIPKKIGTTPPTPKPSSPGQHK